MKQKGCPGCRNLNDRLQRERTFASWVYITLLKRTPEKAIVIEGKEIKAIQPTDEPVLQQDPNKGTITIKLKEKPKLVTL